MLKFPILLCFLSLVITAGAAVRDSLITVSFEELAGLQQKEERLVLVFIKTGWCRYCNAMEQQVFKHPQLVEKMNNDFYVIFLDAEDRREISFSGRVFSFKPTGKNTGIHELAEELAAVNDEITYPAVCFLNKKNQIVFQYQGFLNKAQLMEILAVLEQSSENR